MVLDFTHEELLLMKRIAVNIRNQVALETIYFQLIKLL